MKFNNALQEALERETIPRMTPGGWAALHRYSAGTLPSQKSVNLWRKIVLVYPLFVGQSYYITCEKDPVKKKD
ncbi:MAG: hypothetical protein A3F04_01805 [Candidatus Chisholmbacteria bacterium RIFCSPHIGHO2_12_FULL_49_9]|nr:MAG: hypothetical protein A3F04_01805 [Candidatus Chisholmbacteria bacterium RIFCSPHIGHO2_12_FULL_49_9]